MPEISPKKRLVHYGCGLDAPEEWINFDASPAIRLQHNPLSNFLLRPIFNVRFPKNILYGDIVKGLPVDKNNCDAIFCSHVLEHFSLEDFRKALRNTYDILKIGGIFRLIMPDLEVYARNYLASIKTDPSASILFLENTFLGKKKRPRNLKEILSSFWGNSTHLWLWDNASATHELEQAGFRDIRKCFFNDSNLLEFKLVENKDRFENSICLEMTK
jgi:SAM-dependent methyltransferase